MANLNFNANEVEPATDFEPIPAGKYIACIVASEMRPTKNGNGSYLELTFEVLEGEYKGRKLWARLNLDNPSQMAVKIARAALSSLCRAVGVMQPRDSIELHNLPLTISVKLKKREDNGELSNVISGYSRKEDGKGQPQQAQSDTPPWRRTTS